MIGRRRTPRACPACGAQAPPDARWCGVCGASLEVRPDTTPDAPAATVDDATVDDDREGGRAGRLVAAGAILAVLAGMLVLQAAEEPPAVPAGFSSRGDGARSGVVSTLTVPEPVGVAWRRDVALGPLVGLGARALEATRIGDVDAVVTLDPDPAGYRVAVHDAQDGALRWTTMLPIGNQPRMTSISGSVLAHRSIDTLTVLDLDAGERRFTLEVALRDVTAATRHGVVGVLAAPGDPQVVLLSAQDGSTLWTTTYDGPGRVTRVLDTDTVVVVEVEDTTEQRTVLLGLEPATGAVRWQVDATRETAGSSFPSAPPTTDGRRVLLSGANRTVLVDAGDGGITELRLPEGLRPVAGAVTDGTVLLAGPDGTVAAVDEDGVRWTASEGQPPVLGVRAAGGVVAVTSDAYVSLLDLATGARIGRVVPDAAAVSGPDAVLTADGALVDLRRDGTLVRTDLTGGPQWQAPTVVRPAADLATDAGLVALTTPSGLQVHRVDDGIEAWAYEAFSADLVTAGDLTAPALQATTVAVAPPGSQPPDVGGLIGLFAETGILDWVRDDDRVPPRGTPVLDADLLWLPVGSQVLGFDRGNGARRAVLETSIARADVAVRGDWVAAVDAPLDAGDLWVGRRSTGRGVFRAPIRTCTPPLLHDDLVIVGTHTGDIIARELATGEQPWGERARGSACRGLAVAGDQLVTLVDDRELLFVGLDDGETTARIPLPATAAGAPTVAGDQVLVALLDGTVGAWQVDSPDALWTVDVDGVPHGSVAVDGDTLLVRTRAGELVALR